MNNFSFFSVFFKLHPKFKDFINSDDCIGKMISKFIRLYSVFYCNSFFNLIEKGIISSEKMRNSGYYMYGYAHSFFGKDFQSKPINWY